MKKIRKGIFETNSSSTHAIVVPKKVNEEEYSVYDSLDHNYCYGREECRLVEDWDEKFAYAYMVLKTTMEWTDGNDTWKPNHKVYMEDLDRFVGIVNSIFYQIADNSNYHFTPDDLVKYLENDRNDGNITGKDSFHILMYRGDSYVDHANELDGTDFIDKLLNDYEFVRRFIFNRKSYITIGGDEYRGYNIKTIGFEYDYEYDYNDDYGVEGEFWNKLAEYKKDNDVYLKGN